MYELIEHQFANFRTQIIKTSARIELFCQSAKGIEVNQT